MEEEIGLKDKLIALRKSTGMNRRQFCDFFEIPYMTVSDWEHGNRRVPAYFFRLLEYYVRMEQMEKENMSDDA
ncbi:MAG: helix-turn-helix domain-containing protein [Anaerostipes sp.]|jgi:putative transcriptional regulator|nr:helix-turn-helix transcriptional regulator [Anaerostipes sp.]